MFPGSCHCHFLHTGNSRIPGGAMIIVLFSTFTTTFLDIYSTAVSALNIYPKLGEKRGIIIGGLLGIVIALAFREYPHTYERFLLIIGYVFCPFFGIVLTDFFLTRKRVLIPHELFTEGAYWYTKGLHLTAIGCWVVGALVFWLGRHLQVGGAVPSFIVAALMYFSIMKSLKEMEQPA